MASTIPNGVQQFLDNNGNPLVGGRVHFYIPGTTTDKNTWQDPDLAILNTNPIILNARGEATIWGNGRYRQIAYDQLGNLIWDRITQSAGTDMSMLEEKDGSTHIGFTQSGARSVPRTVESKLRDIINIKDFGVAGDGVTNDFDAIVAFISECRNRDAKGMLDGRPYYIGGGSLNISGVTLEGVYRGHRNVAGTRIIGDGTATVLSQDDLGTPNQYFDLKNIRVEKAMTGLDIGYGLYSRLTNIDIFEPEGDGFLLGRSSLTAGPLGVYADRVNIWNSKGDALKIRGSSYNNSNIFFRCWLQTASPDKSCVDIHVSGGLGDISNRFIKSQTSGVGAGFTVRRSRSLVLDQMYMETQGPAIRLLGTTQMDIRSPVLGSLRNDNWFGEDSFIHHVSGVASIHMTNPFISLGSSAEQENLALAGSENPSDFRLTVDGYVSSAISASGWNLFKPEILQRNIDMGIRDAFDTSWSAVSSSPSIGNGSLLMNVSKVGNVATITLRLIIGSTTNLGSGAWSFSLPYPSRSISSCVGYALKGQQRNLVVGALSGGVMTLYKPETSSPIGPTIPFAWGSGDSLLITTSYQL